MTRRHPVTPAELRELTRQIDNLTERIRTTHTRLNTAPDPATRSVGFRLDTATSHLTQATNEIDRTVDDLVRIQNRGTCRADWGLCPEHRNTLTSSGPTCRCRAGGCRRRWNYDHAGLLCTEQATHQVYDTTGGTTLLCTGHANDAAQRITGAAVTPISRRCS
jgi:hypothetical protein